MHIALPNPLGAPFILDTSSLLPRPRSYSLRWRSRVLLAILALALFFFLWPSPPLPPSYTREWDVERRLLQHNRDLPPPEGRNGRYIKYVGEWIVLIPGSTFRTLVRARLLLTYPFLLFLRTSTPPHCLLC